MFLVQKHNGKSTAVNVSSVPLSRPSRYESSMTSPEFVPDEATRRFPIPNA